MVEQRPLLLLPPTLDHMRETVFGDIHREAHRAHQKHRNGPLGSFAETGRLDNDQRLSYLVEEVGEVARALQDLRRGSVEATGVNYGLLDHVREELVQVAHLAALWVAVLDLE